MTTGNRLEDPHYLRSEQYASDTNLLARIALHQRFSTNNEPWQRWLFDQLELPRQARILELGCGRGDLWAENRDRLGPGWQLTLTDLSEGMLDAARLQLAGTGNDIRFQVADAQNIPFTDASFDVVVANQMLYHVPDRPRALSEIRRVLAPAVAFTPPRMASVTCRSSLR